MTAVVQIAFCSAVHRVQSLAASLTIRSHSVVTASNFQNGNFQTDTGWIRKKFFVTEQNKERLLDIAELLEWKNFQVDLEEECPSLSCQHNGHCVDDDELLLMMTILMLVMMMMMMMRRRRNANVDHVFTMGRKLAADWPAAAASRPRWEGFGGSMGSVGVGLGQGVVLISLLNSLSNKVPPYIPSGID